MYYFAFIEIKQDLQIFWPVIQFPEVRSINIGTNFTEKFSIVCKLQYITTYSILNIIYKY